MDPQADEAILANAQDSVGFADDLAHALKRAERMLSACGLAPAEYCRLYRTRRAAPLVIADDYVFFRSITYDDRMMPGYLTGKGFYYASTKEYPGKGYVAQFEEAWSATRP